MVLLVVNPKAKHPQYVPNRQDHLGQRHVNSASLWESVDFKPIIPVVFIVPCFIFCELEILK
jgi:hypothetical protein